MENYKLKKKKKENLEILSQGLFQKSGHHVIQFMQKCMLSV